MLTDTTTDKLANTFPTNDTPCVWISRDVSYGVASKNVDVWSAPPARNVTRHSDGNGCVSVEYHSGEGRATLLAILSNKDCMERFGTMPSGDECTAIDNPKVS